MVSNNDINYKIKPGNPMILGAKKTGEGINFSLMIDAGFEKKCSVIFYKKGTLKIAAEIPFEKDMWYGNVCSMCIQGISLNQFDYNYRIGDQVITDRYADIINGASVFGENDVKKKTSAVYAGKYDWEGDRRPLHLFSESFIYRLHVRGFTMNRFSKVRKKGTFAGVIEKLDYLKELGVTMVELMPAYEFNENSNVPKGKLNYWGYADADYMMPKVAYSYRKNGKAAINEFKDMVKELHKNDIEVCMEFYFEKNVSAAYMIDCFRHWVIEYHIDGIHCNMSDDIRGAVSSDPYLADVKIISLGFGQDRYSEDRHLGEYNNVFMNTARKFLKGDEGVVKDMAFRIRYNKENAAQINYLATNDSLTLLDTVSYTIKHNEENGFDNSDGTENNYSWNCGHEGNTRSKTINEFRTKQIKNAMCMLMLSQGTPLIYAGDEFGNSARGNNNPYCQDNDISYVEWRQAEKNKELLEFFKFLVEFRREHNILHLEHSIQTKDYRSFGMPDLSYHCERTWSLDVDLFCRQFAYMLNGRYCRIEKLPEEENIYVAYNMHWESRKLGIPTAGKNKDWKVAFTTGNQENVKLDDRKVSTARRLTMPPRSVVVLLSEDCPEAIAEEKAELEKKFLLQKETEEAFEKMKKEKKSGKGSSKSKSTK